MDPESILRYLDMLANNNLMINLTIHILVVSVLASLFFLKDAPFQRVFLQGSICILLLSVATHAFVFGNIFHAITFGIFSAIALVQLALSKENLDLNSNPLQTSIALIFIILGLWYPEFVGKDAFMMLLFSPVGVIPCPTLLTTLGLMTLTYSGQGKLQYAFAVFMGLIYGVIGTFVLKVYLDIALLILALLALYIYWTVKKAEMNIREAA